MPIGLDHRDCLRRLGIALKGKAAPGEQFCVFAFDLMEHDSLIPPPAAVHKADLPFDDMAENHIWNAAFYSVVAPSHTEKAILATIDDWISYYTHLYDTPRALYIYSRLIPCQRDGSHGNCADLIASFMLATKQRGWKLKLYLGWGNDDVDAEMAHATKHALADLEDDGVAFELFPGVSIAG